MRPITTMYPEDPRSPFYDPSGRPMLPLARLYLDREEVKKGTCGNDNRQPEEAEVAATDNAGGRDDERRELFG